ncbi:hypothetical protein [Megasphaera sp. UPII 135-E]|uniref:hypothetical protein n=1 Tax=Megasphaera sp. UPII 135-E TaxID=1000569 RepID=UPI00021A1B83|nr:hypothetical protein [Megasphaera sp. UPII 135-E]EGS34067.1 hypothetical protein HMPREF1040_0983 [Megasphaera sp. UPII 135-E]
MSKQNGFFLPDAIIAAFVFVCMAVPALMATSTSLKIYRETRRQVELLEMTRTILEEWRSGHPYQDGQHFQRQQDNRVFLVVLRENGWLNKKKRQVEVTDEEGKKACLWYTAVLPQKM